MTTELREQSLEMFAAWKTDWVLFAHEALGVTLDQEQQDILYSVQNNSRTSVASGTARGKDFIAAVSCICFMYLTPSFNENGDLIENTKIAMTAPTDRQVKNIMVPEVSRLFNRARKRGVNLPGRLVGYDIRTENEDWFLTGFKSDDNHESWSGFHAVNTMFVITEATGISENIFEAIEGNLQGNSRVLIVFNPNTSIGYAAESQKSPRWNKFRLNSLNAVNVTSKQHIIPGQVDYAWVVDKIELWCEPLRIDEINEAEDDFEFEGQLYRPNDTFRKKVLGKFPKVGEDSLIPALWIELANDRWKQYHTLNGTNSPYQDKLKLGADIAGMGVDSTCFCYRFGKVVQKFHSTNSGGRADHMQAAGSIVNEYRNHNNSVAFIDTCGEGAGVYSRLVELRFADRAYSCKFSEGAKDIKGEKLTDITGQYTFHNMRAYLFWAVRDWLNPKNNTGACLPPDPKFLEEATQIKWMFQSNGSIIMEPKEDIKARLKRSTDYFDSLANTFYPEKAVWRSNMSVLANLR